MPKPLDDWFNLMQWLYQQGSSNRFNHNTHAKKVCAGSQCMGLRVWGVPPLASALWF
jgi:hypothetical protein